MEIGNFLYIIPEVKIPFTPLTGDHSTLIINVSEKKNVF